MAMRVKGAVDRAAAAVSNLLDTASQKVASVVASDGTGDSGDSHPVYRSSGGAGVDGSYGPSGQRDDGPSPQQYHTTGGAGVEGSYGPGERREWWRGAACMKDACMHDGWYCEAGSS
jgi:hypothetical protein